mmetsp:Transcript_0/g.1  ORF Transcript_0/g.1 Transcript_0/m.1 type:complete len:762 (-) Transcript_0:84-2369(-)
MFTYSVPVLSTATLALAICSSTSALVAPPPPDTSSSDTVLCRIFSVDVQFDTLRFDSDQQNDVVYRCETDQEADGHSEAMYSIDLPKSFIDQHPFLDMGETVISIANATTLRDSSDEPYIYFPPNTSIKEVLQRDRHLGWCPDSHFHRFGDRRSGNNSVLVLRISANDTQVRASQKEISAAVFGLGDGALDVNLHTQFDACSIGKLNMQPAMGPNIIDGVGEIDLEMPALGLDTMVLENEVTIRAEAKFGSLGDNYDFVMFCMPRGVTYRGRGFLAYAYLNHYRSVFHDEWCINLSAIMHEIGHSIGLRHSGENGRPYRDVTGLMGFSSRSLVQSCFNANKNWLMGWYEAKSLELTMDVSWRGRLHAFVDYAEVGDDDVVIIKVGDHIYMQFNRARSFNAGTRELLDQVAIVYNEAYNTDSDLIDGIAADGMHPDTLRIGNFDDTGYDLVIDACTQAFGPPDYVELSIHVDDGIQSSACDSMGDTVQSAMPSTMPSVNPSQAPSYVPSFEPTSKPTGESVNDGSGPCEDNAGEFPVGDLLGTQMSCLKLSRSAYSIRRYCEPNHPAFDLCPDTCGKCIDNCFDSRTETFWVNAAFQFRNCVWLSVRPAWQARLCRKGEDAYIICGETCNSCDFSDTDDSPSMLPTPESMEPSPCEDSPDGKFALAENRARRDCDWLSNTPVWQRRICHSDHEAYKVCPTTCGACGGCEDAHEATFLVNRIWNTQNCAWLASRRPWQPLLCREGHPAYSACKRTCNSCVEME